MNNKHERSDTDERGEKLYWNASMKNGATRSLALGKGAASLLRLEQTRLDFAERGGLHQTHVDYDGAGRRVAKDPPKFAVRPAMIIRSI